MKTILKRRGQTPQSGQEANPDLKVLTASDCLGKTGNYNYIAVNDLLHFIDNGRIEDIREMDAFFELVKERTNILINRKTQTDKGGNPYKYQNFIQARGPEGVKVMIISNILNFIRDYQKGLWITNFTLDELVTEAEKNI